jgi:hypothetical protein
VTRHRTPVEASEITFNFKEYLTDAENGKRQQRIIQMVSVRRIAAMLEADFLQDFLQERPP